MSLNNLFVLALFPISAWSFSSLKLSLTSILSNSSNFSVSIIDFSKKIFILSISLFSFALSNPVFSIIRFKFDGVRPVNPFN